MTQSSKFSKWRLFFLGCVILSAGGLLFSAETAKFALTDTIKETESRYTTLFLKLVKNWPPKDLPYSGTEGRVLHIKVYETPGNEDYIGIEQTMIVNAPTDRVEAVLDDVNHYADLFPGFADIHLVSKEGNRFDVYWENSIPIFFIPNTKFWTTYTVDKSNPAKIIYRAQLKEKKGLKTSDTLIVLEADGKNTKYAEYDFYDADYGILKTLAPKRIWKDSVEAVIVSDLNIKMKAENPQMPYSEIMTSGLAVSKTYPIESLIESKKPHPLY